jgi:hypothetical protein
MTTHRIKNLGDRVNVGFPGSTLPILVTDNDLGEGDEFTHVRKGDNDLPYLGQDYGHFTHRNHPGVTFYIWYASLEEIT